MAAARAPAAHSPGNATRYGFDRLNRLITQTNPLGAVTTSVYDLAGNKIKETDRLGRVSTFVRATQIGIRRMIDRPPAAATGEIPPEACLRSVACFTDTRSQGCKIEKGQA